MKKPIQDAELSMLFCEGWGIFITAKNDPACPDSWKLTYRISVNSFLPWLVSSFE